MTPACPEPNRPHNDNAVREDDLQAYVDGQLDTHRRAAIEAHLAAHPDEAARLAAYRSQNIGLHALFDPRPGTGDGDPAGLPPALAALAQELDAQLDAQLDTQLGTQRAAQRAAARPAIRSLPRLAASVALLLAAGIAGWIALERSGGPGDSHVVVSHEAAPAAPAPLQPLPAAARVDGDDAAPAKAGAAKNPAAAPGAIIAAPAVPAAPSAAAKPPAPAADPLPVPADDPAIERVPLIPVPLPEADDAAKET